MFIEDLIIKLSIIFENKLNDSILLNFQEYLLKAGIFTLASQIMAIMLIIYLLFIVALSLISIIFSFNMAFALILAISIPTITFVLLLFMKIEKRAGEIERSIPDFLRQLSSMLRVGLSLENALVDLSNHGKGPLYEELRRVAIEIRMGKSFDESFNNMAIRLNSKDLGRSFKIILNAHKSGSSLSDIILDLSDDLRAMLILKRERKASVMMSIMFLILASIVAAPFALGMIGVYSSFMIELGKGSAICEVAPLAAEIYLIIHSICAGFLIALIMYGDLKKGIRYSIPITVSAFLVFYLINSFGISFFGF
ncbi:flagellar protein FlaJ [Methanobrevibacter olleyae]|uniref:Flagellar protein FlaJ n=1 Tax=Methanobrevibacter olleyae TaxID=294671 RepID=A0A1I4GVY4_METOL|nr:type II secretion system F family protein [Methanobrevibacter olleyae]SFL34125.1 flagellar protein FlaJ [Methanobrevibacter olleyae]